MTSRCSLLELSHLLGCLPATGRQRSQSFLQEARQLPFLHTRQSLIRLLAKFMYSITSKSYLNAPFLNFFNAKAMPISKQKK